MSNKQILIDGDDSFKELQVKWRNNSLSDDEKDLYIKHLTLRHIDKKKSSRELQAENERLRAVIRDAEDCLACLPIADSAEVYDNTMRILNEGVK